MQKPFNGYTIVEVMLVLTISLVMFVGVTSVFNSRKQGVEFTQALYDLQSKITQYSTQISTGNFTETNSYTCGQNSVSAGSAKFRPVLTGGTGVTSSNQDCIFLGKVLLPVIDSSKIYAYDILGLRNIHSGLSDTGVSVQTTSDAMPEPAGTLDASGNFIYLFTDNYILLNNVKIISAKTNGASGGILKIYSSLQNNDTSSRGLKAYSSNYTYASGDEQTGAETSTRLRDCIQEASTCTTSYSLASSSWDMCIKSGGGQTAILSIKPSSNGLVTKLNITGCS